MRKIGLDINKPIKYNFNKNFFKEETEDSFYWAGFLAADGCITDNKYLKIGLSIKDRLHLEKFKNIINASYPIKEKYIKVNNLNKNWNNSISCEMNIYSEDYFNDLQKFNIVPRKSLIYTFPDYVLNHKLCHHFMRGYLDGDGCFHFSKPKMKAVQLRITIAGTEKFLTNFKNKLNENCNLNDRKLRKNKNIYCLEYNGNLQCKRIVDYLYKDSTIYLDRKYDIIKKHYNL